jgi:hypothetical protein
MVALIQPPVQRRELRFDSWEFRAASDLARRLPYSPRASALIGSVVRDPALLRVFVALWRLPVVHLHVRRADADAWSGTHAGPVGRAISSARRAQAVPPCSVAQPLRTTRALRFGIQSNVSKSI